MRVVFREVVMRIHVLHRTICRKTHELMVCKGWRKTNPNWVAWASSNGFDACLIFRADLASVTKTLGGTLQSLKKLSADTKSPIQFLYRDTRILSRKGRCKVLGVNKNYRQTKA